MRFRSHDNYTYDNPPEITAEDVINNVGLVHVNQQGQNMQYAMPEYIIKNWWKWLDQHHGDSNTNLISNQELSKYYQKQYLWKNTKSYAFVTKIDNDDYTVVAHDNQAPSDALISNYILVPAGAM